MVKLWKKICKLLRNKYDLLRHRSSSIMIDENIEKVTEEDKYDWWTKYMRGKKKQVSQKRSNILKLFWYQYV